MPFIPLLRAVGVAVLGFLPLAANALILPKPDSLIHEVLSEAVPTAFAPADLAPADFSVEWAGPAIPGVTLDFGPESLQWVRVSEVLVIPRARLRVLAPQANEGRMTHAGFSQVLAPVDGAPGVRGEMPVALVSDPGNAVELSLRVEGRETAGKLRFRFKPRKTEQRPRVMLDPSCSRFAVEAVPASAWARDDQWVYIGCRFQIFEGSEHRTTGLEMYVFWDGVGQKIQVAGLETPSETTSVWPLRLSAKPGFVRLKAGSDELSVRYRIAEHLKLGSFGVGIGPYSYSFEGLDDTVSAVRPMLTLYGSYFITETVRVVAFNATALSNLGYTDFGIYLGMENFRVIDRRLVLNILLGGHTIGFFTKGDAYLLFGLPQGFEVIYTDAFKPGNNLSAGGFIYPLIEGKSYYNLWLRWGSRTFGEINYIAWEENLHNTRFSSRSLGVTFGFPFFQFL